MVCLNPKAVKFHWYNKIDENTGECYRTKALKFSSFWDRQDETTDWVPCGKCEGCRIDKANDWATRAYLESQNHTYNAFLTLTYDNAHLPHKRTLQKTDLQKFWKKLRKHLKNQKISYLACGEYGPTTLRPHYHAAVFGYWPEDCKEYKKNEVGDMLYTSETVNKIWGNGYVIIGNLTYESAAYIARYVYKKAYGGEQIPLKKGKTPEFTTSSKRPAIAKNFYFEPYKWLKIIRNNGVLVPSKTGLKIKPIPQYLRKKWKENAREDYYLWQEQQKQINVQNQQEILSKTSKNFGDYRRQTNEIKKEQLKRLDKHRNDNIDLS